MFHASRSAASCAADALLACRPAKVVRKATRYLEVEYDNGERDKCDPDNIFPHDVPIDFGKEVYALQASSKHLSRNLCF